MQSERAILQRMALKLAVTDIAVNRTICTTAVFRKIPLQAAHERNNVVFDIKDFCGKN